MKKPPSNFFDLVCYPDLISVVSPRAELHEAGLLVEGEVPDVNLAGRFKNGRRGPQDLPRVPQHSFGHRRNDIFPVSAVKPE
jgi:hypothetical protein